ncbi:MAG: InlB B-repeat-containing protein [Acholeplasma sp.]|nr:InlB B-repeat-containing protein [Acholeplasma sp.]
MKMIRKATKLLLYSILIVFVTIAIFNGDNSSMHEVPLNSNLPDFSGSGSTIDDPYIIKNANDMKKLSQLVQEGYTFQGNYFKVDYSSTNGKITLTDYTPIGSSSKPFSGNFDGNNVYFTVLLTNSSTDYVGLFGYLNSGSIKKLVVAGSMTGKNYVGGVVGYNNGGSILQVANTAIVMGESYVGGIVGYQNSGTIQLSFNDGQIKANVEKAGGIVGHLQKGTISNTYNHGEVLAEKVAGGIVGHAYAARDSYQNTIQYSYSSGLISANTTEVNGIIGVDQRVDYNRNSRTALYYDTSVLSVYDQPYKYKPEVVGHGYGKTSEWMLDSLITTYGYPGETWYFKSNIEGTSYYPQLRVFSFSEVSEIAVDSLASVSIDVSGGLGTSAYPFLIRTKEDMDELSRKVSEGNSYLGYYFKVDEGISSINLGDFQAIGTRTNPFRGTFNGNGVNFELDIEKTGVELQGLFGYVYGGTVENLSVSGNIKAGSNSAGIVGWLENGYNAQGTAVTGYVRNVYNTAKIESDGDNIGGIIGYLSNGVVTQTYNRGEIIGNTNVGGVVGYGHAARDSKQNEITQSYSAGKVAGILNVGGVIGLNKSVDYNRNVRTNLYYDVIVIANYDQPSGKTKPSSLETTTWALNSGEFFTNMSGRLNSNWVMKTKDSTYAYYPQLAVFAGSEVKEPGIKSLSEASVKVDISEGMGTEQFPFIINNEEEIQTKIKDKVEAGNTFQGFYFKVADGVKKFELGNFIPIGSSSKPFYGSFDGNNAEFVLDIDSELSDQGLFGYFGIGTVSNLYVSGKVKGLNNVGGIVGYKLSGNVTNVYNLADISGSSSVGGIVGYNNSGNIIIAYNDAKIVASVEKAGGIVGHLQKGTISNTYNHGEVLAEKVAGGIVGHAYAARDSYQNTIQYSYSSGLISANTTEVNGIIGVDQRVDYNRNSRTALYYDVSILKSYSSGLIHKPATTVGGQGLDKTSMFESNMISKGFSTDTWYFKEIDGNYAYYPQLRTFALNSNENVVEDSIASVITNPFLGDGTKASPYIIRNANDMRILANAIGADYDANDVYYLVEASVTEIDLTTVEFKAIGSKDYPFKGHFDGNYANFILGINSTDDYQGLFGNISSDATIDNISVSGIIVGNSYVGGIVGNNSGTLTNVYSSVNIKATGNYVGGIAGYNGGSITTIYNTGHIETIGNYVGGITGFNNGQINEGYSGGRIYGNQYVGGLIGYSGNVTFENLYYNQTVVYYADIIEGLNKPLRGISNLTDYNNLGLEKEYMTGLDILGTEENQMTLDSNIWVLKATSGLYDYYPQIKAFANHTLAKVKENSVTSARVIRFKYGAGTKNSPYLIKDETDMKAIAEITVDNNLSQIYFKVMDGVKELDLTIADLNMTAIGPSNSKQFKGGFDGNGATIIIDATKATTNYMGLFGYVGEGAEIKNIVLKGFLRGQDRVGSLAGEVYKATINNIYSDVTVIGRQYIGGVIGVSSYSTISEVYNMADITASSREAGGILGWSQHTVLSYAFNFGVIKAPLVLGGIIGNAETNTKISYVYNRNRVEATGTGTYVGGITGYLNAGTLDNAYSAGAVIGKNISYIGGLVGRVNGSTLESNSYYDLSLLEAELLKTGFIVPRYAIGNKLDSETVKGINKSDMVGNNGKTNMTLSEGNWVYINNDGVNTYYPQLKVFNENLSDYVKEDSLTSVKSYVFVGDGAEISPYIIVNKYDMNNLSLLVNQGISFEGLYFKVKDNVETIDLTYGINYEAIGTIDYQFKGIFDGKNTRFVVKIDGSNNQGLFGYVGENGIVKNLSVSGTVNGNNNVGSVVGTNEGLVDNVYSVTNVSGNNNVAGIIGLNKGMATNLYHIGDVVGNSNVSGLIGYNEGTLENAYASSSVFGASNIGGVVGYSVGSENEVYYNSSKTEVSENETLLKPTRAISNKDNTDNVKGVISKELYNSSNTILVSSYFKKEKAVGFYAYYPQLASFSNSSYTNIKNDSKTSVTVSKFNEGTGTLEDPFIIRNEDDMESVSEMTQAKYTLAGIYFKVASDVTEIDLTKLDTMYMPIGNLSYQFQGNFDGNNANFILGIERNDHYQGLFGVIGANGIVINVNTSGFVKAIGKQFTGGIVGRNYGTIENVYNTADVTGSTYVGGISGWNDKSISYAFNSGIISNNVRYVGGITGGIAKNSLIEYVYNTGNVYSTATSGYTETGGISGYVAGNLSNAYSTGAVYGRNYLGGIAGRIEGSPVFTNTYYVIEANMFLETTYAKATKAISNSNVDGALSVYKNQLTGDKLFGINLDLSKFVLKQSEEMTSYYPQLKVFVDSNNNKVVADSLESVTNDLLISIDETYNIVSAYDFRSLGIIVKQGYDTEGNRFKVHSEASVDFEPIKNDYYAIGTSANPFKGDFDGNNILMNVAIENSSDDYQGIFGYASAKSTFSNINLKGYVKGNDFTGLLIGYNLGTANSVMINDAIVTGNDNVGLAFGYSNNQLTNISTKGKVIGGSFVGGIVGYSNNAKISASYFMGTIEASGGFVGGVIGRADSAVELESTFAHGSIKALSGNYVGGFSGYFSGAMINSYATMNVLGGNYVGGIVGYNNGNISDVYYSGELKANNTVGGVAGKNEGTIQKAYYNKTEITLMRNLSGYHVPETAVYGVTDLLDVKGLEIETMTGLYAVGSEEGQMEFDGSLYHVKSGYDFTMYFPELNIFRGNSNDIVKSDSLTSITYNKIEGKGTKADPYLIYDGYDMMTVHQYVANEIEFNNKHFKVAPGVNVIDLTLEDLGYTPIGSNEYNFKGFFDGSGVNFIVNLIDSNSDYQGLFHTLGTGSIVHDLTITGTIKGKSYIGGLTGRNLGTVYNIENYAEIISVEGNDIGGIIGYNEGNVTNVYNYQTVSSNGSYTGGIVGQSSGKIKEAFNRGKVTGNTNVGGIAGRNLGTIEYSYNVSEVDGVAVVGGIAGETSGNVTLSYNSGDITASDSIVGGIIGVLNNATVYSVYNGGTIIAKESQAAGIIANFNGGTLYDAYHFGSVYTNYDIGIIVANLISGNISRSYYDNDKLNNDSHQTFDKPTRAIGNKETSNVIGLFHGQMIGLTAIGKTANNMNLYHTGSYLMQQSEEDYSYYPQIKFFANHSNEVVKNDSIESVRTITFIVGSGTKEDPFVIRNESDWIALADSTNHGNDYLGKYFIVSDEIFELNFVDAEEDYKFISVGTKDKPFNGSINGQGVNIRVNITGNNSYQGLFGYVGVSGHIKGFSVSGTINGNEYVAGIVGYNEGLVEEVYNQANISGKNYTAGVVGYNTGTVKNVYNKGEITGNNYVGGILGYLVGQLTNSYNSGIVYGKTNNGTLVGYYESGIFANNFYDATLLKAYRSVGTLLRPKGAVGNSNEGSNVKGLDNQFMTGTNSLGNDDLQISFENYSGIWSDKVNLTSANHYPQLLVFANSKYDETKVLSQNSTINVLYIITFDEDNETDNTNVAYVISNHHFNLYIPKKIGYNFVGWYYGDTRVTDGKGDSVKTYQFNENIELTAHYEIAYFDVSFIDGNNKVVKKDSIQYGSPVSEPEGIIPTKNPDSNYVYKFKNWQYDFNNSSVVENIEIFAEYEKIDRYYEVIYYDGNDNVFAIEKGEYEKTIKPTKEIPTKEYLELIAYKFVGWEYDFNKVIISDIEIKPLFEEVDRYYDVSFFNGETLMGKQVVEYLHSAIVPEELPTKESTVQYDYKFTGWDKNFDKITEDLEVHAVFNETLRKYTVVFKDGNDAIFASQTVEYGKSAATPVGKPTREYLELTAYKFIGWDKDYSIITGDLTVKAKFDEVDRYYQVKFYNALNELISVQTVEYLKSAVAPSEEITKEPTVENVFTFKNWNKDYSSVESSLEIYPVFETSLRPYRVYFLDGNGDIYNEQTVLYGKDATLPSGKPTKAGDKVNNIGYKFTSWDTNYKKIKEDTYVKSNYNEVDLYYIVTFYHGETIIKSEKVEYGFGATAPLIVFEDHPNVDKGYEYYFIGWDKDFSFIESDLTVNLKYGSRLKQYTVTVVNGNETTTQIVEWGKNAVLPTPVKTGNEQITYVFESWNHDGKSIKEDTTITASFTEQFNYYEVRFYDGDLNLIKLQKVVPGDDAIAPSAAFKTKTDEKVYIFTNWDKDYTEVESDLDVYAKFKEVDRYYIVIFYDAYGDILSTQTIEYGNDALEPLDPEKAPEGIYEYTFVGWDKDFTKVNSSLEVKPLYEENERKVLVEFYDGDLVLISSQLVTYGKNAVAPITATKTPTDDIFYIFDGWNLPFTNITEEKKIYAEFKEVDRYYDVIFIGQDDLILDAQVIEYGKDAIDPRPYIEVDILSDTKVYAIIGWDLGFKNVTEDLMIRAIYAEVDRYYQVTFNDYENHAIGEAQTVEYGKSAIAPSDPTKPADDDYFYIFDGWDLDYSFVTSNLDVNPIFKQVKKVYNVVFIDGDGNEIEHKVVEYGKDAVAPLTASKSPTASEMFIFTGWDQDFTNVTKDLVVTALFSSHIRSFTVIFKDVNGNVLKEEMVEYNKSATAPNIPTKEPTKYFEYVGKWDQDFSKVTKNLIVNLSYEEVARLFTATFYDDNDNILKVITGSYETIISAPTNVEKPMTEEYVYNFVGWDPEFSNILTENVEYRPVFDKALRLYEVKFMDGNDEVFDIQYIKYGGTTSKPEGMPEKDATQQYYYIFRMWEANNIKVYQDLVVKPLFYRYLQQYKVTFVDENGNTLTSQMVEYGTGATEPDLETIPVKPSTKEFVYVFSGWDKPFGYITEETEVKTVYIGTLRKYSYTFYDDDQITILKEIVGVYGDPIVPPSTPTKEGNEEFVFEFIGWNKPVAEYLTENVIYIAQYKTNYREYRVLFYDGNKDVFEIQKVRFNGSATNPERIPTKASTVEYQYVFTGWDKEFTNITEEIKVYALFTQKAREYQVTFVNYNGDTKTVLVEYNKSAWGKISTPVREGYSFMGWDKDISKVNKDITTYAKFTPNYYDIIFNGTDAEDGHMEGIVAEFDNNLSLPENQFSRKGYTFIGWRLSDSDLTPTYLDGSVIFFDKEGMDLYATWQPITYNIIYDLDGGVAVNPTEYTIEDRVELQDAIKEDYKFVGWYILSIDTGEQTQMRMMKMTVLTTEEELQKVEIIEEGHIGNITLIARYKYDGYIQLKDESMLGMYYAEASAIEKIEIREDYSEDKPVYLIGALLNQTLENLRENFTNDNLVFWDSKGKVLDDSKVVATGYQIVILSDDGSVKDRVYIVLKGDINGDGRVNANDTNALNNHISKKTQVDLSKLIAADVNGDGRVNANDTNALNNHISKKKLIYDPNETSTLELVD